MNDKYVTCVTSTLIYIEKLYLCLRPILLHSSFICYPSSIIFPIRPSSRENMVVSSIHPLYERSSTSIHFLTSSTTDFPFIHYREKVSLQAPSTKKSHFFLEGAPRASTISTIDFPFIHCQKKAWSRVPLTRKSRPHCEWSSTSVYPLIRSSTIGFPFIKY